MLTAWVSVFALLTGWAHGPGAGDSAAPQGPERLSFSEILAGADLAGVVSRLEEVEHETVCFEQDAVTLIGDSRKRPDSQTCIGAVLGEIAYINERLVSALSEIILNRDCSRAVTPYSFSHHDGASNTFYIPGQKHLIFHGPGYGWILIPVSEEAADHALSGGFCTAAD